jgi:hypothetical protein
MTLLVDRVGVATDAAVMFATPGESPRTTATVGLDCDTEATAEFEDDHTTAEETPPNAVTAAVRFVVAPTAIEALVGVSVRVPMPDTPTVLDALLVVSANDVAVTVTTPGATAVSVAEPPVPAIAAIAELEVVHETPVDAPFSTETVAISCAV